MQIGVISEGHADRAVIENIIVGLTGIDSSDIVPIRPSYLKDETDKAAEKDNTTSSYSIIKKECEEKELLEGFLATAGHDFVVIHIDTAEADRYGVDRPQRKNNSHYCEELREAVITEINKWLAVDLSDSVLYAVAIEEIDAWVLALYEDGDTVKYVNPKSRLNLLLSKKGVKFIHDPFDYYSSLTHDFKKTRFINNKKMLATNCSLRLFCEEVVGKVVPKMTEDNTDD